MSLTTAASASRVGLGRESRLWLSGLGWSSLGQLAGLAIRLVSNVLLARWLAPESYGLLGTALAVLTTLEWLSDLGIGPGLVRHPRGGTREYLLTGWWLALGRGGVLTGVAVLCAWPLAEFYGQAGFGWVLAGLGIRPTLAALRSPGLPVLRRRLEYRGLFIEELSTTLVGTALSLVLAWSTHGIGSIVAGTLGGALAGIAASYLVAPMRVAWCWDAEAARELGRFGRGVMVNTLVMALWLNVDRLVGLKLVSVEAMGAYAVACNLAYVAETLMTRGLDVYFGMMARRVGLATGEVGGWHEWFCRRLAWWGMPLGAVGVGLSPLVIAALYDERYAGARWLFAVLMARLLIRGMGQVQFQELLIRGELGCSTRAYGVALGIQVLMIGLLVGPGGWGLGVEGLALACLVSTSVWGLVQGGLVGWRRRSGQWVGQVLLAVLWACVGLAAAGRLA